MKFLVDELPYYEDYCPFASREKCYATITGECPRHWDKYKITSYENPHECELLKEISIDYDLSIKEEK